MAFINSFRVAPSLRFIRSRIVAALLPSRAPAAFFAPLATFLAGVAFLPDLAFFGATCARRAPTLAFFVALGSSAVGTGAVSGASAVDIIQFPPFGGDFRDDINHWSEEEKQAKSQSV